MCRILNRGLPMSEMKKNIFQLGLTEAFKKKSCAVSPNCFANAVVHPNSLSLKKTNLILSY